MQSQKKYRPAYLYTVQEYMDRLSRYRTKTFFSIDEYLLFEKGILTDEYIKKLQGIKTDQVSKLAKGFK